MKNSIKYKRQYAYRERNKEKLYKEHLELVKRLYKEDPTKALKYAKEYYQKNKTKIKWRIYANNQLPKTKAKRSIWNSLRRKQMGKPDKNLIKFIDVLIEQTNYCSFCGVKMDEYGVYPDGKTLDHIKPLGTGGKNKIGNIRILCFKCNVSRPKSYPI